MKKITAVVPDNIDGALLAGLITVATEFKIEEVGRSGGAEPIKHRRNTVPGKTGAILLMEHFAANGVFSTYTANGWLTKHGYAKHTARTWLRRLEQQGYVRDIGSQRWQFVKPFPQVEQAAADLK